MSRKIRESEPNLSLDEMKSIHFELMNQQCPVHRKSPYVETKEGEIEYTCCSKELNELCRLVLMTHTKKSD